MTAEKSNKTVLIIKAKNNDKMINIIKDIRTRSLRIQKIYLLNAEKWQQTVTIDLTDSKCNQTIGQSSKKQNNGELAT